jgi:pilus assembly protein CpaF
VRKFTHRYTRQELVGAGTLSRALADDLVRPLASRQNALISCGMRTGKTTLLNALASTIPEEHRVGPIEETSEIRIDLVVHIARAAGRASSLTQS